MQTFLPYRSFEKSARCLDYKRLGKQRVEAMQILNVLKKKRIGLRVAWGNHPAVLMWEGFESSLRQYLRVVILEWKRRGYRNTIPIPRKRQCMAPPWVGRWKFHRSHQSNLKRKDRRHYKFHVPANLPYHWPVRKGAKQ